jgi:Ca2+-binding EF-hand superfamily protein
LHTACYAVSFQIYDADGDTFIDKAELRGLVTSTMREHDVVFSSDSIARIVDETFAEIRPANPSDGISFEE